MENKKAKEIDPLTNDAYQFSMLEIAHLQL